LTPQLAWLNGDIAYFTLVQFHSQMSQAGDRVKLELFDGEETARVIGAVVVKSLVNGEIQVDLGPADGAPSIRVVMSRDEAFELGVALHDPDGERVILVDD
jgi:hypothetical protein